MLAEIHHKISSTGSNLSSQLEDKLTGDVFGALRYIPFSIGLKPILQSVQWEQANNNAVFTSLIDSIDNQEFSQFLHFWPWRNPIEPDIVFEPDHFHCWIEVKYTSRLSGNDQLMKQAEVMQKENSSRPNFLILLARQEELPYLEKGYEFPPQVHFGTLSWQTICRKLLEIKKSHKIEFPFNLVLDDILELLIKKGFDPFSGFQAAGIEKTYWLFELGKPSFNFTHVKTIDHEQHFRFDIK